MWRQGAAVKCTGTGNSSEPESPSHSVVVRAWARAAGGLPDLKLEPQERDPT